jgi:DNA-binding GntR family transcriptional regulator
MKTQLVTDAAVMHALYTLADYSVLAELASKRTQASQLDGRACRAIYDAALPSLDWQAVSDHEREFMRRLGVQAMRNLPPMMDELFRQHHEILKGLADSDAGREP